MSTFSEKLFKWLESRFGIQKFIDFANKKTVPKGRHAVWYYFGGVSLFLFIIQVLSGILLLLYFRVGEESSYESVRFIVAQVEFGWLIRSVHSWSANLMVLAAFIHMFSVFFTKAFRKPRELTWYSGFILLLLSVTFGFSGYLLPWNELAFFATKVGTDMIGSVPYVGEQLLLIVRGGEDVTGATVSRFFGLHVAVLPGIFVVFLTIHLMFVQLQGMSKPENWDSLPAEKRKTMPFFPNFVLRDLLLWLIILNVLVILAVFLPMELGMKADAFAAAPAGIKPEWYFMFMFQTLKYIPPHVLFLEGEFFGIIMFSLGGLIWFLVPFWDAKTKAGRRNRIVNIVGLFVIMFIIVMSIIGFSV